MATVAATSTVTNAQNLLGKLYLFKRRTNTVLELIGGLSPDGTVSVGRGWREEPNYEYATNVDYDLPAPSQPAILEGAAAPTPITNQMTQTKNVTQIFHETVKVTYLKQSTPGRFSGVQTANVTPQQAARAFQLQTKLMKIAQDTNYSFLRGTFSNPADPAATALKTRGLITSVVTNVFANGGTPRALTQAILNAAYKGMIDNAGIQPDQLVLLCNTDQMLVLNTLYQTAFNQGQDRMIGGTMVRTIYTPFGVLNIALELDMPTGQMALVNPNVIQGVYNTVDGKGSGLFYEALAKTGSTEDGQLYGQFGIDHGPEYAHGLIKDLS